MRVRNTCVAHRRVRVDAAGHCFPRKRLQNHDSSNPHRSHLCHEVEDVEAAMVDLKAQGVRLLSEKPKIGAHGVPVVFLHPKDTNGVLVELQQAIPEEGH